MLTHRSTSSRRFGAKACASVVALVLLSLSARPAFADDASPGWHEQYERAKAALLAGRHEEAVHAFEELSATASTDADQRLALELLAVAQANAARAATEPPPPHVRTGDELSVLYTTAFVYGVGSGAWIVLLTEPENVAGALLPFVALTSASVAGVAFADSYRPFRRGVPHSIAAGLYLGAIEGIWLSGFQRSSAARREDGSGWSSASVATAMWAGATVGGIAGGFVGAWREPTPGRVSFTGSAAIWPGIVTSFTAGAIESDDARRGEIAFLAGGIAYNLGIVAGLVTAPGVAPSVARVRFIDLGGLGGGLLGAGTYAIFAESGASERGGLAASAGGAALGLGFSWWLTRNMPKDHGAPTVAASVRPLVTPVRGGWVAGFSGEL
jgi:hypothetical protein